MARPTATQHKTGVEPFGISASARSAQHTATVWSPQLVASDFPLVSILRIHECEHVTR